MKSAICVASALVLAAAAPARGGFLQQAGVLDRISAIPDLFGGKFPWPNFPAPPTGPTKDRKPAPVPSDPASRAKPDLSFTPGRLCTPQDPDFKEYRYPEHIAYCARNVTYEMKKQIADHYGVPESEWRNYEFDHLIPLSLGGDSHIDNIWPQPRGFKGGSDEKDQLENELFSELAAGKITQAEAVRRVYAWFGITQFSPVTAPHAP